MSDTVNCVNFYTIQNFVSEGLSNKSKTLSDVIYEQLGGVEITEHNPFPSMEYFLQFVRGFQKKRTYPKFLHLHNIKSPLRDHP